MKNTAVILVILFIIVILAVMHKRQTPVTSSGSNSSKPVADDLTDLNNSATNNPVPFQNPTNVNAGIVYMMVKEQQNIPIDNFTNYMQTEHVITN